MPIPVIPTERRVELPGPWAALLVGASRKCGTVPAASREKSGLIGSQTSRDDCRGVDAHARQPQVTLIRVQVKGNKRVVGAIETTIVGPSTERHTDVSVERWDVARGVYRFTLSQKLEPGEYVFAETVPDQGMNLYVWDFGVDASASAPTAKK